MRGDLVGRDVQVHFTLEEFDDINAMCGLLKIKRAALVRMGLNEVARQLGRTCKVRLKANKSYDRESTAPRAWADREQLFHRRSAGESAKSLAAEYGIRADSMATVLSVAARELSSRPLQQAIRADLKEMAVRVLDDPFISIPMRSREIAKAIIAHETYDAAGQTLGVSRQRVQQVAVRIRSLAGGPDGRKVRWSGNLTNAEVAAR